MAAPTITKNCEQCGKPFKAKRADARFCSAKCRVNYGRMHIELSNPNIKIPEEDIYKLSTPTVVTINKKLKPYDREANLKAFQKMGLDSVEWISTGIPAFDELTKIPRGRLTQIEGRYGVGKTTLCLNMIKGLKGHKVLYIDSESSLNPELLIDLELDAKEFTLYNDSSYLEDISEVIRKAVKESTYEIIILDSVAMTTTRTRADSDITASNIGQKAFILNKMIELIIGDLRRSKTALVFINQVRDKIGGYFPETYTPGGSGILYNASLMVSLKTIKSWRFPKDPKDHIYQGHEVEATIIKSKVNTPWRVKKFKLFYPQPHTDEQEKIMASRDEF